MKSKEWKKDFANNAVFNHANKLDAVSVLLSDPHANHHVATDV